MKKALARMNNAKRLVSKLAREYRFKLRGISSSREALNLRRSYIGRVASILNELNPDLELLAKAKRHLSRLPSINTKGLSVVIAGASNVGKSSFVKCVSTAKPSIASYPFTTKDILVGHLEVEGSKLQIIDTPGLLDRPLSSRGKIELKAITALRHLANLIISMIDPSETCGYPLDKQVNIFKEIKTLFKVPCFIVLNKVDLAREDQVRRVERLLTPFNEVPVFKARADLCMNTLEVLMIALKKLGFNQKAK